MMEEAVKEGKKLRRGYTTGTCAAASAKAAAWMLLTGKIKDKISILTPGGVSLTLDVSDIEISESKVSCSIKKDSGDDPDITNGAYIFAEVSYLDGTDDIKIEGGEGIGKVTKPGLDQPVGEWAINSVPRKMILENVEEIRKLTDQKRGLLAVISVPGGERLSKKTFNPRLGIEGGISILGTTGIVEPMSEQSLIDTIRVELNQKKAMGEEYALITPGNYGMDYIRAEGMLDPSKAVMVSNFIGDALSMCEELGFKGVLLIGHIGKLVKLAAGMFNTHSKYGDARMEIMTSLAAASGLGQKEAGKMLQCATCDDAIRMLKDSEAMFPGVYERTMDLLSRRITEQISLRADLGDSSGAVVFSREYGFLFECGNAKRLIKHMTCERI